jgi:hypothetical protein
MDEWSGEAIGLFFVLFVWVLLNLGAVLWWHFGV